MSAIMDDPILRQAAALGLLPGSKASGTPTQPEQETAVAVAEAEVESESIPSLTEIEKEPEEVRQYEIQREAYWEKHYERNKNTFPTPLTPQLKQKLVWDATEQDVTEFKKSLYQISGADRKPVSDTVLVFKNEEDADEFRDLGFDTVAAVKGPGTIPFQIATTDVTGGFCTSGSEREFTLEERWYADEKV